MRTITLITLLAASLLALTISIGEAAPINFTEVGDLSTVNPPPGGPLGTLDIGLNTFSGTKTALDHGDIFLVVLPGGLQIAGINMVISNLVNVVGTAFGQFFVAAPFQSIELNSFGGDGTITYTNSLPQQTADTYGFQAAATTGAGKSPFYDWNWNVTVAAYAAGPNPSPTPTPEPGTLLLLGSGLVGTGVVARRRHRRK